jgi:hypothetical protein
VRHETSLRRALEHNAGRGIAFFKRNMTPPAFPADRTAAGVAALLQDSDQQTARLYLNIALPFMKILIVASRQAGFGGSSI